MTREPEVGRPHMPAGYGPVDGLDGTLPWSWAEQRLTDARTYWVVTASPEGAPHAAPVWGLWADAAVWFSTDPESTKGRNLARGGPVVVHLDSGDDAIIVHGRVEAFAFTDLDATLAARLDDAYAAKYADPATGRPVRLSEAPAGSLIYRVAPRRILGWRERDFPRSRTAWRFPD